MILPATTIIMLYFDYALVFMLIRRLVLLKSSIILSSIWWWRNDVLILLHMRINSKWKRSCINYCLHHPHHDLVRLSLHLADRHHHHLFHPSFHLNVILPLVDRPSAMNHRANSIWHFVRLKSLSWLLHVSISGMVLCLVLQLIILPRRHLATFKRLNSYLRCLRIQNPSLPINNLYTKQLHLYRKKSHHCIYA